MFNYASTILSRFNSTEESTKVYSINSFRIDVEDYVYIVEAKEGAFILYETDYFFDQEEAVGVLKAIAAENNFTFDELLYPNDSDNTSYILRIKGTSRIYLVAKIKASEPSQRIDPVTYGGSTTSKN